MVPVRDVLSRSRFYLCVRPNKFRPPIPNLESDPTSNLRVKLQIKCLCLLLADICAVLIHAYLQA